MISALLGDSTSDLLFIAPCQAGVRKFQRFLGRTKSNHRRLAQRRTCCYIGSCETARLSSEDLLCQKRR